MKSAENFAAAPPGKIFCRGCCVPARKALHCKGQKMRAYRKEPDHERKRTPTVLADRPHSFCRQPAGRPFRPCLLPHPGGSRRRAQQPAPEPGRRVAFRLEQMPRRPSGGFLAGRGGPLGLRRHPGAGAHRTAGLRRGAVHQHPLSLGRPGRTAPAPDRLGPCAGGQLCEGVHAGGRAAGPAGLHQLPGGGAGVLPVVQRRVRGLCRG